MKKLNTFAIAFNGVGALIGLVVAAYVIRSTFYTEAEPPCSTRYPPAMQFSLAKLDGAVLSPNELQARVGLQEWGVTENTKVVPVAHGPAHAALEVNLANVADGEARSARPRNGVDFRWHPAGMKGANSACLSYSVWLPEDFAYGSGGALPGVFGGAPTATLGSGDGKNRFSSHVMWRANGDGWVDVKLPDKDSLAVGARGLALARGRWIGVEEEVVLNAPGKADGVVRLWVNGELRAENSKLALRTDEDSKISGVLADVGYLRNPKKVSALRLSPFMLAWQ